jgi:hypothetical protein
MELLLLLVRTLMMCRLEKIGWFILGLAVDNALVAKRRWTIGVCNPDI